VPALKARARLRPSSNWQDGQSFVIAGLMDNRVTDIYNQDSRARDIPIWGICFAGRSLQKSRF